MALGEFSVRSIGHFLLNYNVIATVHNLEHRGFEILALNRIQG